MAGAGRSSGPAADPTPHPPTAAGAPQPPAADPTPHTTTGAPAAATVPRQKDGTPRPRAGWTAPLAVGPTGPADLLDDPDPAVAADAAAVENLLRCWVREAGLSRPDGPTGTLLRIPLPASGTALLVAVRYWSPAGWHRFGPARFHLAPATAPDLDAVTLAALIAREGAGGAGAAGGGRGGNDLVGRVADSVRRTAEFIADRRERPTAPAPIGEERFLTAEQSLLLGHPLQPDPKSREGLSETEARRYSPELHGSFPCTGSRSNLPR